MLTKIEAGWIVGHENAHHTLLKDGVLVFKDERIVHVGQSYDGAVDRTIDARGKLVCPGFIDGSLALSEFPKIDPLPVASLPDEYATPGVSRKRKMLNATEPHQPLLKPGESFQYSSGSRLRTATGAMHGTYFCVAEDGERFEALIPMFVLEASGNAPSGRTLH